MISQAAVELVDSQGWGVAEWLGLATIFTLVLGAVTGTIVQVLKLRSENTSQHEANQVVASTNFVSLDTKLDNLGNKLDRMDGKIDRVETKSDRIDTRLDNHLDYHRNHDIQALRLSPEEPQ